ncbi:MAG: hypothetical protein ACYCVB_12345 [Bacilli bacterium]
MCMVLPVTMMNRLEKPLPKKNGLEDHWLPSLSPDASPERCKKLLADWHSAWTGRDNCNGPALVATIPDASGFVGMVSFSVKRNNLVEMTYGIAPS